MSLSRLNRKSKKKALEKKIAEINEEKEDNVEVAGSSSLEETLKILSGVIGMLPDDDVRPEPHKPGWVPAGLEPEPELESEVRFGEAKEVPKGLLLVADVKYDKAMRLSLDGLEFQSYSKLFVNRDCKDLSKRYKNLWLNIKDSDARRWLELNLKTQDAFKVVLVSYRTTRSKWIEDIKKSLPDVTVLKYKNLRKVLLSKDSVADSLEDIMSLHGSVGCLGKLFSCSKNISKKGGLN